MAQDSFLKFAPRPPMGWNSWDCFATTVTEAQTISQAEVMARDLKEFGWEYVVVDIQWYEPDAESFDYRENARLVHDEFGRLQPAANRFPSAGGGKGFAPLAEKIHALGLKFGVHLLRGIPRTCVEKNTKILGSESRASDIANRDSICSWNPDMFGVDMSRPGAQEYYNSVFAQFAEWGVDFVKVDDISRPYHDNAAEIEAIRKAIDASGRPMVLSLSPGETPLSAAEHVRKNANMWRISDDFWDDWRLLFDQFERLQHWAPLAVPGAWPDADMLPIGRLRFGEATKFTKAEQQTLINLWCLARSPLMMGGDLTQLDAQTKGLLTNRDLLRLNQEGKNPVQVARNEHCAVWRTSIGDEIAIGIFNLRDEPLRIGVDAFAFGAEKGSIGRSIWENEVTAGGSKIEVSLDPHASVIYAFPKAQVYTDEPRIVAHPFPIESVRLLPSMFKDAQLTNGEYLLNLDVDRMVAGFRINAGLPTTAERYPGWESMGISGHSMGHLLSALAWHYAVTDDPRHLERAEEYVSILGDCLRQVGTGYLSSIPDDKAVWEEIRRGEIRSAGFDLNGLWVPWYTNHKILAGFIDCYLLAHNDEALELASRFAEWAIEITKGLTADQWQKMLACEHGGMNEALFQLANITGRKEFEELARKFDHHAVLNPLRERIDQLAGLHSNTQIPKIIGLAVDYELSGRPEQRIAAEFFWSRVAEHRTYANGGNSNYESLGQADQLANQLSTNTSETCNTHNMLKLTRHVFGWEPDSHYFDYYEKALFNHIYSSQNGHEGQFTYYQGLASRNVRPYSEPFEHFWCCVGTGMENHTRYGDSIFFHEGERLYVNLFIPSRLHWPEMDLVLEQRGDFLQGEAIAVHFEHAERREFTVAFREPTWTTILDVELNGTPVDMRKLDNGYVEIRREWVSGDVLSFKLESKLRIESMPDDPRRIAVLYGPILLAADTAGLSYDPVMVTDAENLIASLKPSDEPMQFRSDGLIRPEDLTFRPFWSFTEGSYTTYFDVRTLDEWKVIEEARRAEEARVAALAARTTDYFRVGEMQPERDHNLTGDRTETGRHMERNWRHAQPGGFFEFTMMVRPGKRHTLIFTFWSGDGGRDFHLLVNGETLINRVLERPDAVGFFDVEVNIPESMTRTEESVTVRFQASERTLTPGLYGARMVTE
ncbi:MAG: glycoside hydrolase family 127 protein [Fimbriimonadaceae bacterium]|nr:glycoside hydrolase family 127 protein [Fimbriimonadaceae bacterium]